MTEHRGIKRGMMRGEKRGQAKVMMQ
jgi:hypothetical protein